MPETPEIPEASGPFEKRVAITIAVLAAILTLVQNKGDDAKTAAIITTSEAANEWGYYQSKSLKQNLAEAEARLTSAIHNTTDAQARAAALEKLAAEARRYEKEKEEIKAKALALGVTAAHDSKINNRCDSASLGLQMGIVVSSVAILSKWRLFWFIGVALGAIGAAVGLSAFVM